MMTTAAYASGDHLRPGDRGNKSMADVVPFLAEEELNNNGESYSSRPDWQSYTDCDDNMITVQNPASSEAVAKAVLAQLG